MKKSSRIVVMLILVAVYGVQAQETPKPLKEYTLPKHNIKAYPISTLYEEYRLGYERKISKRGSAVLRFAYIGHNDFRWKDKDSDQYFNKEYELDLEYRYYFQKRKEAFSGWYVGPRIKGALYESYSVSNTNENPFEIGIGVSVGYQWVFKKFLKGLTLDAGMGIGYGVVFYNNKNASWGNSDLGFSIGYSW